MEKAKLLSHFIAAHPDFELVEEATTGYDHMGALVVDGVLQAGIRYETVVVPRVELVLARFPEARTPPYSVTS